MTEKPNNIHVSVYGTAPPRAAEFGRARAISLTRTRGPATDRCRPQAEGEAGRLYSGSDRARADPSVWSGRALQEDFVELAAVGLASMYPAFVWSVGSWPSWISARVRSH